MALLALVVWAGIGWAEALATRQQKTELDRSRAVAPARWKLGSGQEQRFEHQLRRLTRDIPAGSRIGFTPALAAQSSEFFLTRWAIYHLPEHLIVPAGPEHSSAGLEYWLTYQARLERSDLELLHELPTGAIYRVHKP